MKNMKQKILTMIALVGLLAAPAASASHLDTMAVAATASGLTVTLHVEYTPTGACCGGSFQWTTGDGASGSVPDGTTNGAYAGDASGSGTLSDGRSFTWTRSGPTPVRLDITYDYTASGTYTIEWDGCCPAQGGSVTVTVEEPCKEVGVGVPSRGVGGYVFVGNVHHNVDLATPPVGVGACLGGAS